MREPTAGRRTTFENNTEIDTLLENVRLFAKRHQPCGRLWIDVPQAPARETTRRITAACFCGDTLEEIVGMPVVSSYQLGEIIEALTFRARQMRARVA
jgi:hypothetical protein